MRRVRALWTLAFLLIVLLGCRRSSKPDSSALPIVTPPPSTTASAAPPAVSSAPDPLATNCGKAIACCKLIAEKAGYKKQENQCAKFDKYSDARCKAELGQLQQAARIIGADCKKLWAE